MGGYGTGGEELVDEALGGVAGCGGKVRFGGLGGKRVGVVA